MRIQDSEDSLYLEDSERIQKGFRIQGFRWSSWSFRGFRIHDSECLHGALEDSVWGFSQLFMEV